MSTKCTFFALAVTGILLVSLTVTRQVFSKENLAKRYTETVTDLEGDKITFDMVLIPGGTFNMGSPAGEPGREDDEGPQHMVQLEPFYLCTTETTMELFLAYYYETYTARKALQQAGLDAITGPTPVHGELTLGYSMKHPAFAMTWQNAVTFCKWLSKKTGKEYRLPAEAEWEYAARAGSNCIYGFSDDPNQLGDFAWYKQNADFEPHEVATKKQNAWGLYDMLGNVQEWVQDFYSPDVYEQQAKNNPSLNPQGPADGKVHVARGGYYDSTPAELRCAARGFEEDWWRMSDPQIPKSRWWLPQMNHVGFRVASSAQKQAVQPGLRFAADGSGGYTFNTGVLTGRLRKDGASMGLSSVMHISSRARIDKSAGILSYYRIFTRNKRYGEAAWQWPSSSRLLDNGAVEVTWPAAQGRPFEMTATYRWSNATALDVETAVRAEENLSDFEVFLASYFDEHFPSPYMYVSEDINAAEEKHLRPAKRDYGEWQMFPRSQEAVSLIRDGRWKIEPNPVDWADKVRMAAPICLRRNQGVNLAVVLMAPAEDCFATATPYEGESHYSLYLSLFGRNIDAGQTARARSRLVVTEGISEQEILDLYRDYTKDLSGRMQTGGF